VIDPAGFRLVVDGLVDPPLSLDLDAIRRRPRVSVVVTLECAGNGRARLLPRPVSQPWLVEALGTVRWTGTPVAAVLREAGVRDGSAEVVFTGADHGVERGVEQDYQRSLTVADCLREDVLLAYEMNDAPLPPQHGFPLRLLVPGWYGMAHVKWLTGITAHHFEKLGASVEEVSIPWHRQVRMASTRISDLDPSASSSSATSR
jgi:sulfane dehydrogenase subunit SoxC